MCLLWYSLVFTKVTCIQCSQGLMTNVSYNAQWYIINVNKSLSHNSYISYFLCSCSYISLKILIYIFIVLCVCVCVYVKWNIIVYIKSLLLTIMGRWRIFPMIKKIYQHLAKMNSIGISTVWFFWVDVYKFREDLMENQCAEDMEKTGGGSSEIFLNLPSLSGARRGSSRRVPTQSILRKTYGP